MSRGASGGRGVIGRAVVLCSVGAVMALAACAGTAHAAVYWAHLGDYPQYQGIGRALNDGTHVSGQYLKADGPVTAIATDSKYIYYLPALHSTIARANLDGTGVNTSFITNAGNRSWGPQGALAVDSHHIYWANGHYIGRANLDGTSPNPTWVDVTVNWHPVVNCGGSAPYRIVLSLAVSSTYLYFVGRGNCDFSTIGRVGLDGSNFNYDLYGNYTQRPIQAMAVDSHYLYWLSYHGYYSDSVGQYTSDTGNVGRANLDGTGATDRFISDIAAPFEWPQIGEDTTLWSSGLAVDSSGIYWASDYGVGRAALDGTGKNDHFINLSSNGGLKPTAVVVTPACPTTSYTASGTQTAYFAETYQPSATGYTTACDVSEHKGTVTQPTNLFVDGQVNALRLQKKGIDGSFYTVASELYNVFGPPRPIDYVGGPGTYRWQVEAGYAPTYPGPYTLSLTRPTR